LEGDQFKYRRRRVDRRGCTLGEGIRPGSQKESIEDRKNRRE